jgi:hypothetical protein
VEQDEPAVPDFFDITGMTRKHWQRSATPGSRSKSWHVVSFAWLLGDDELVRKGALAQSFRR